MKLKQPYEYESEEHSQSRCTCKTVEPDGSMLPGKEPAAEHDVERIRES